MNKKSFILFLAILLSGLLFNKIIIAQSYNYNLRQLGNEFVEMCKQPGNWQTKDWLILTGIAGGTFTLIQADEGIRALANSDRSNETCLPIVIGDKFGEGWGQLLFGTSFLVAGILQDNNANKRLGFEVIQSFTYSLTVTGLLKVAFGRARPFMNEGSSSYQPFQIKTTDRFSLPSGHTTAAFSFSTVLAAQSDNVFIKIAAFTPAMFTALARIYYDKHWASDVFLGAAVGYFVGRFVTELHENKTDQELMLPPSVGNNQITLVFLF